MKVLVIGAGEYMSLRTERMLAILDKFPDQIEIERHDISTQEFNGIGIKEMITDEFSDSWLQPWADSYKTAHWVYPVKRKPKPYYRQGSRW